MLSLRRLFSVALTLAFSQAFASTKGLNQIVTPDIQPIGALSLAAQVQHQIIGNSEQIQAELGITKSFEIALFKGVKPGVTSIATELSLAQTKTTLLSAGFLGWSTAGDKPQPFLEGGYYKGPFKFSAGVQRSADDENLGMVGLSYQQNATTTLQADYLTGDSNFATFGVNYAPNASLSINPAIYMANSAGHKLYPYLVVSYTIQIFKG